MLFRRVDTEEFLAERLEASARPQRNRSRRRGDRPAEPAINRDRARAARRCFAALRYVVGRPGTCKTRSTRSGAFRLRLAFESACYGGFAHSSSSCRPAHCWAQRSSCKRWAHCSKTPAGRTSKCRSGCWSRGFRRHLDHHCDRLHAALSIHDSGCDNLAFGRTRRCYHRYSGSRGNVGAWDLPQRVGGNSLTGVAGSFLLVLVWIYYQAQIVLAGCQLAKVLHRQQTLTV